MMMGEFTAESFEHLTEMEELLSVLKPNDCQTPPVPTRPNNKIIIKKQNTIAERCNLLRRETENYKTVVVKDEVIEAHMQVDIKEEKDAVWNPLEEDNFDPLEEDHSNNPSDTELREEASPPKSAKKRRNRAKKGVPKRPRGETKCLVCGHHPETLESSVKHFLDLLGDPTFQLTTKLGKELCPVCELKCTSKKVEQAKMVHMRVHFEEAHHNTTKCEQCSLEHPTL